MENLKVLEEHFQEFALFDDPLHEGKKITLNGCDKWFKYAGLIDGTHLTSSDTGIYFLKYKSDAIDFFDFLRFIKEVAACKDMSIGDIIHKLTSCGLPGFKFAAQFVDCGARPTEHHYLVMDNPVKSKKDSKKKKKGKRSHRGHD